MKHTLLLSALVAATAVFAQDAKVQSPDGQLDLAFNVKNGVATYTVNYSGKVMLNDSPLGFKSDVGDFTTNITFVNAEQVDVTDSYTLDRIKTSNVNHAARELVVHLKASDKKFDVRFHVTDNDVAFRYELPRYGDTGCIRMMSEATGFSFPEKTTTFICPQSDAMIGWKRSKPSYEEEYTPDAPMNVASKYGHGYTFPCLFHVGDDGWVLVSETGVDSRYCASHLSDCHESTYTVEFPMAEENNGNGTSQPAFALPGNTPWRTITVGSTLKPIVETTIPFDVVRPLYETSANYKYGKSTWSWIVWQDNSMNYNDQVAFIDLAATMGYSYILIDAGWDVNIGYERMETLIKYAQSKNVDVFLWYSSSGYWNDIVQTPINHMDNSIIRKREMKWMHKLGVKGIKVDFFGGDKQETIRLYEQILSDADDNELMVIFHGCTLPRGWERMYPNYVGSEAVLASENLVFDQHFCDAEGFNATLHPFCRNTVGSMEFGGCFLNQRLDRSNKRGTIRRTSDVFELATAVLFQNPIQNFAITPNNLEDSPKACVDFMREVPTTWDKTVFIDGYPGRYIVMARLSAGNWYIVAANGQKEDMTVEVDLSEFIRAKEVVSLYSDNAERRGQLSKLVVKNPKKVKLKLLGEGAAVIVRPFDI